MHHTVSDTTVNGNTVRSFSAHRHLSAAQGSSTTVSRSDIRLIQYLDSSALWSDGPEVALNWLFPFPNLSAQRVPSHRYAVRLRVAREVTASLAFSQTLPLCLPRRLACLSHCASLAVSQVSPTVSPSPSRMSLPLWLPRRLACLSH
jgi:hypothetical protein